MGRKTRNKIPKRSKVVEEKEADIEDTPEYIKHMEKCEEERQIYIMYKMRQMMLEYVELNCWPLCDYLDMETLVDFVGEVCN
jgi:tRNA (Thr-GGU) A37 N-methylase